MKNILSAFATLLLAGHAATAEPSPRPDAANGIPFADSLEAANVTLPRMFDGQRESLILGNGDLYGIVWEKDSGLFMRITKNDIWDARVDTSKDGELPRVDIASHKITGPGGAPPGYGRPYPPPRCAAARRRGPELSTAKTPPKFKHRSPPPPPRRQMNQNSANWFISNHGSPVHDGTLSRG